MSWPEMTKLQDRLRKFAEERDWEQFHSPKNLAMALAAEAGELLELFQWLTEEQSRSLDRGQLAKVVDELADVQIYLARLADKLNVNLGDAVDQKIRRNETRYPADKVRGSAKKYSDYE